ncbi:MAG: cadherin-like beta sandwich domain-containing protein [Treponema sp.]|nr:cadherin-like beta sandwich domain-containing protein [Treponema sp.]
MKNSMKAPGTAPVLLVLLSGILLFPACENPYVQELLRGSSALDNISVSAYISAGAEGQTYAVSPHFNADTTGYTVRVPYQTKRVDITAVPHREGPVTFLREDGTAFDGSYPFTEDLEARVFIRVETPYMDARTYGLTILRGPDSWLQSLRVKSGNGSPSDLLGIIPGFDPEVFEYTAEVPQASDRLEITGLIKDGVTLSHTWDGVPGGSQTSEAYIVSGALSQIDAPEIKITVSLPSSGEADKTYTLQIIRPKKVSFDDGLFSVTGTPWFYQGDTVSFRVIPPFGAALTGVFWTPDGGTSNTIPPNNANLYTFTMPDKPVSLSVTSNPVPPVTGVKYVRGGGAGNRSGDMWANASGNLQKMIDTAAPGEEIWIAKGTVTPDWSVLATPDGELAPDDLAWKTAVLGSGGWAKDLTPAQIANSRNWAFVLKNGVKIYGGFTGTEQYLTGPERSRESRDWKTNETILSGGNNAAHVVIAAGVGTSARLEGLTISGGNALLNTDRLKVNDKDMNDLSSSSPNTSGAGVFMHTANPVLRHVTIRDNSAAYAGGGIFAYLSNPILLDVDFSNNTGQNGAAIYSNDQSSKPLMIRGSVTGSQGGSGITGAGAPIFVNVTISGNRGAGIIPYNPSYPASPLLLINVTVSGNVSGISGLYSSGYIHVYNSVIKNNGDYNIEGNYHTNGTSRISGTPNMINGSVPYDPGMDDLIVDEGDESRYPVNPDGTQNDGYYGSPMFTSVYPNNGGPIPGYSVTYGAYFNSWASSLQAEVLEFLTKDNAGNDRFKGSAIDIGAHEAQ